MLFPDSYPRNASAAPGPGHGAKRGTLNRTRSLNRPPVDGSRHDTTG